MKTPHSDAASANLIQHRVQSALTSRADIAASRLTLKPSRLCKVDREPVALALVTTGHFGAGVAQMLLNVGLLDLGRGGEAGAQRMAAEREPPLALAKVAAKAGGQGACLDEPHDVLVGQPLPRDPAVLASDWTEEGTMG